MNATENQYCFNHISKICELNRIPQMTSMDMLNAKLGTIPLYKEIGEIPSTTAPELAAADRWTTDNVADVRLLI